VVPQADKVSRAQAASAAAQVWPADFVVTDDSPFLGTHAS
jgi:hypothetical protein